MVRDTQNLKSPFLLLDVCKLVNAWISRFCFCFYIKRSLNLLLLEIVGDELYFSTQSTCLTLNVEDFVIYKSSLDPSFISCIFSIYCPCFTRSCRAWCFAQLLFWSTCQYFELDTHAPNFTILPGKMVYYFHRQSPFSDTLFFMTANRSYSTKLGHNAFSTYQTEVSPDLMLQSFHNCISFALSKCS